MKYYIVEISLRKTNPKFKAIIEMTPHGFFKIGFSETSETYHKDQIYYFKIIEQINFEK